MKHVRLTMQAPVGAVPDVSPTSGPPEVTDAGAGDCRRQAVATVLAPGRDDAPREASHGVLATAPGRAAALAVGHLRRAESKPTGATVEGGG